MQVSDLTSYANEKYGIEAEHKWREFPNFAVLCHPITRKWLVLIIREWSRGKGEYVEKCDIRCGNVKTNVPYISHAFRMKGPSWVGISFDNKTDKETVFELFDRAVNFSFSQQHVAPATIILNSTPILQHDISKEVVLNATLTNLKINTDVPSKIRQMYALAGQHPKARVDFEEKTKLFLLQADLMKDYLDNTPWDNVSVIKYFPTYNDLSLKELRAYFSWRTQIKKGIYPPIALSLAYIYIYELLNGVGCTNKEERFAKIQEFEKQFVDAGYGDKNMQRNIRQWLFDLAIALHMPQSMVEHFADEKKMAYMRALQVLCYASEYNDDEVFSAIVAIHGGKTVFKKLLQKNKDLTIHLVASVWRHTNAKYRKQERNFFNACFGYPYKDVWDPLKNAVFARETKSATYEYKLNRMYVVWRDEVLYCLKTYPATPTNKPLFKSLIQKTDSLLQQYFKINKSSQKDGNPIWADSYILEVIEQNKIEQVELQRQNVKINTDNLTSIRSDASVLQDELLSEEEKLQQEPTTTIDAPAKQTDNPHSLYIQILSNLLDGREVSSIFKEHRLLPSIAADCINELYYDSIGDNVVVCEKDRVVLVEDYREEIQQIIKEEYGERCNKST